MTRKTVLCMFLFSLVMTAQIRETALMREDVAPLKHWSAPIYWQPSVAERMLAAKGGTVPLAQTPENSLVFVGITPCRLVDTRGGDGFTGPFGPPSLAAGSTRSFPFQASTLCSIPSIAQAYSLNVTVVPPGALGYLTIWPYGAPQPLASSINDSLGIVIANAVIVPAGDDTSGSVDVYASANTDLVIDINGYYAEQSGITLAQGTVGAPSLSFAGDAGTGIFSSGTGTLNNATGGTNSLTVAPNGNIGIGTTTTPAAKLEVNGNAQVDGNFSLSGSILENGVGQLLWAPNDGSGNFSVGLGALLSATTGAQNTAVGDGALHLDTTGFQNTAVGNSALSGEQIGALNTAIGFAALQSDNAGAYNTAVGEAALGTLAGALTCCIYNTALGAKALSQLYGGVTGSFNTAVGAFAGSSLTSGDNNIYISNVGANVESGTIRIGCSTNCSFPGPQTAAFIAGIYGSSTSLQGVSVVIDANGQLGTVQSSRRFKENIEEMGDASDGLMKLRPVTFRYKRAFDDGSKPVQYGLIAEEVAEVYPDLVARSADGQVESVRYQLLYAMLLNELQKQHATITAQKEQIRSLEERLAKVEAALEGLALTAAVR